MYFIYGSIQTPPFSLNHQVYQRLPSIWILPTSIHLYGSKRSSTGSRPLGGRNSLPLWKPLASLCLMVLLLCGVVGSLQAQPIREYLDLQTHPTMHMTYGFFGKGLEFIDQNDPPKLSHKHLLTNVNYADYLMENKGSRIIVHGAILPEVLVPRKKARERILAQLKYVNDFAAANSEHFAVAKTPAEVRELVHTTNKTIIIHSIEGAKRLLDGPEDAQFWADQGIAFMTLIHLIDDEFGGAAVLPEFATRVINYRAAVKSVFAPKRYRGLTEKGKQAIQWLADAGIMTDLTHMSDQSRADALDYMEAHHIPPLVTHDMFKPVQNHPRGLLPEEVIRVYQMGGMMSLPVSGISNLPHDPEEKYQRMIDSLERYCSGSIDTYKFSYQVLQEFVEGHVGEIRVDPSLSFEALTETEKVDFAIGFQSDFNGWLDHHRPRYGEEGCDEVEPGVEYEAIELEGMPHPGLLNSHWHLLEKEGVDLEPVLRASEKFLQMWEGFLERRRES